MKLNDPVSFARDFARLLHHDRGQAYDGRPYVVHLDAVVANLLKFDFIDKEMLTAGFLHDTMEDTGVSFDTLVDLFGLRVAAMVEGVTDAPGENRKARKAATYPKIKATTGALPIKLADRISNVEHGLNTGNVRMQKMYAKEQAEFSSQLRVLGEYDAMWNHLESLLRGDSL